MILTGDFIQVPDWLPGMEVCLTIVAGLLTTLLVYLLSAWFILPIVLIFCGFCWYGSMWTFTNYHFFFSPLFPILSSGLNFSVLGFIKFLRSDQEKRYIRGAFSRYVSSNVVDKIVASPDQLKLEGEEKDVSILFSDIRGFTTMSEKLTPDQVSALLKNYLTPMTRTVIKHHGTLDKFIGDAVMAFWNAPLEVPDHRFQAVSAGLAMLEALPELNKEFAGEYGLTIQIGIGVHSGRASVGNMGSEDLFDYTVLGDNVNLASRLEGLTKYYGVPIIVSDAMQDVNVEGYSLQELDKVTVKGKEEPVTLFTMCKDEHLSTEELDRWQEVLGKYRQRSFQEALHELDGLVAQCPEVRIYKIYRDRCIGFLEIPPSDDWQCVFSHVSK
jgi:adenylate cyclase